MSGVRRSSVWEVSGAPIYTVGHGTATADEFATLLADQGIQWLVDVRRYPGSRRNPQFGRGEMESWLSERGIDYRWEDRLGGRRKPDPDSVNQGLRNEQFRAYADHMATSEFRAAIIDLLSAADDLTIAVMCSESVWWRCHRRLVADHLTLVEERQVLHLFHGGNAAVHPVTPGARMEDDHIEYGDPTLPMEG